MKKFQLMFTIVASFTLSFMVSVSYRRSCRIMTTGASCSHVSVEVPRAALASTTTCSCPFFICSSGDRVAACSVSCDQTEGQAVCTCADPTCARRQICSCHH